MSTIGSMVQRVTLGVITAVIFVLVGVYLGPTFLDAIANINSTALEGVPLADVIVLIAGFLGTFYYLAIVVGAMALVWVVVRPSRS